MFKTYDQILSELLSDWQTNSGVTDVLPGSLAYTFLAVVARALRVVWFMVEQMVNLYFVSTSKGSFLERRCAERGVIRKAGTAATGTLSFTRTTPAPVGATVSNGTIIATLDGKVEVTVNDNVILPAGWTSASVAVTCSAVGASGNVAAGTAMQIVGAQVVGVQNIAVAIEGLTGGTDTETDDALRSRYLLTIQNPQNGGTASDYEVWAASVQGVTSAKALPLNRGPGTVDVLITDGGIPSDSLVTSVSDYIQTKRPIGADVQVIKPIAHSVDVTGVITAASGYTNASLITPVTQAITNYITGIPIGGVVRVTGIIKAALDTQGVADFALSVPAANITLGSTELATADTLNIS